MSHGYRHEHSVYLVDLERPLEEMLMVLADHCEEGRMYSAQDVLMLSLHLLWVEHNVKEAIEAMQIDVSAICTYNQTPYTVGRINTTIETFLREMHRLFHLYRFYNTEGTLDYTFGGWHGPYTPIFIPYSHIHRWPKALSAVVGGEPQDTHPGKLFSHPFPPDTPDPHLPF